MGIKHSEGKWHLYKITFKANFGLFLLFEGFLGTNMG